MQWQRRQLQWLEHSYLPIDPLYAATCEKILDLSSAMGIYNKLADDINEVDIIIAGGMSLPISLLSSSIL